MITSKNSLLDHFKSLRKAVEGYGLEAILSISDFSVLLRHDNHHAVLHPHFLATSGGVSRYSRTMSDDAIMFAGWLPYKSKRWPIASDKLVFKAFAREAGLRTPEFAVSGQPPMKNVVIKRASSSFGERVAGPFRNCAEQALDTAAGEYYERFVYGSILKVWYWNDTAICAEVDAMPWITGDGTSTAAALVARRIASKGTASAAENDKVSANARTILHFYGLEPQSVLAKGKKVNIDFRYGSLLMWPANRSVVDLRAAPVADLAEQLHKIGSRLFEAIPAEIRGGTLWTVDAIVDKERRIWLLEVNSNPTVHPLAYGPIVASLEAAKAAARVPPKPLGGTASQATVH